jgi:beta-lactamase class A
VIDAAPPAPPALVAPAPQEVSFGRVTGTAPPGTTRLIVSIGDKRVAEAASAAGRFALTVDIPRHDVRIRVTAVRADGHRASSTVGPVFGLPLSARASRYLGHLDANLQRRLRSLATSFPGAAAIYVQDLGTGLGAAWNARATFPAASTLKLAIAVTALERLHGRPRSGSPLARLMRAMLVSSDNRAANTLEAAIGGSVSAGSDLVDAAMRSAGLTGSEMYGGYVIGTAAGPTPIPLRVDEQPRWGVGKHTTAYDLARLLTLVHLAAAGRGSLVRRGVSPAEARWLLYLLVHSADRGKLDRFLRAPVAVPHKAGWIASARHDAGIVYWPRGAFVACVMTYGVGVGVRSDVLAGRVAKIALERFREVADADPYDGGHGTVS